jgi:hypothetical protein
MFNVANVHFGLSKIFRENASARNITQHHQPRLSLNNILHLSTKSMSICQMSEDSLTAPNNHFV